MVWACYRELELKSKEMRNVNWVKRMTKACSWHWQVDPAGLLLWRTQKCVV